MPPSTFRPAEVDFFQKLCPEWVEMKKKPVNDKNVDQLLKERTQFVCKACKDFLLSFPERDPSVSDPGPLTFSEEFLEKFPQVVRQWFRNKTRTPSSKTITDKQAVRRQIHARNLATQRYKQQINELAREIRQNNPDMNQMTAFNKGTSEFLEQLKVEDLEQYEKLHQDAAELRSAEAMDYADMSPEVLSRLLTEFPQHYMDEVEDHGRNLPVYIWSIVALAVPPAQQVKMYTVSTRNIHKIQDSAASRTMKEQFTKWLKDNAGLQAPGQVQNAVELVYPDLKGSFRPRLPAVTNVGSTPAQKIRGWLRTFFNYIHMWQGGSGSVSWKMLSKDTSNQYIQQSRLPPGVSILRSPSDMTKDELEAWYRWITAGQDGRLRDDQVFQFSLVLRGKSLAPLNYPELQKSQPKECNLTWKAAEKQYAYKVQTAAENRLSKPDWLGLPLARLHCIFHSFSDEAKDYMTQGLGPEYQVEVLVDLISRIEHLGPVHTSDTECTEPLSAYMKGDMSEKDLLDLIFGQPLRPAALLEDDPEYPDYALSTFIRYAKTTIRLRHAQSGTWRGGPNGVRWVLAIYLHFTVTFSLYKEYPNKLSTDRIKALDACNFNRLKAALLSFAEWLMESLRTTIERLQKTYSDRAHAWKEAVVNSVIADSDDNIGHESVSLDTHGIPRGRRTLRLCYDWLQETDPDVTIGPDNLEFRQANRRAARRAVALLDEEETELEDYDSISAEHIELPSDDTDEEDYVETDDEMERVTPEKAAEWYEEGDWDRSLSEDGGMVDNSLLALLCHRDPTDKGARSPTEGAHGEPGEVPLDEESENIEPTWDNDPARVEAGSEPKQAPNLILPSLSPVKLRRTPKTPKPTRRWQMEVVIPTTGRKSNTQPRDVGTSESTAPQQAEVGSSSAKEPPDQSPAARRPRRSISRGKRGGKATRAARKGSHRAK